MYIYIYILEIHSESRNKLGSRTLQHGVVSLIIYKTRRLHVHLLTTHWPALHQRILTFEAASVSRASLTQANPSFSTHAHEVNLLFFLRCDACFLFFLFPHFVSLFYSSSGSNNKNKNNNNNGSCSSSRMQCHCV